MANVESLRQGCTGCGACVCACPRNAITMQPDAEGFLYPFVDTAICTQCGYCSSICPQTVKPEGCAPRTVYAANTRDDAVRLSSSSGGLFTEAARVVLADGGCVFGVTIDGAQRCARFSQTDDMDALAPMRGSKYVQADTGDVYARVKRALRDGRRVLFVGCPCHVAALRTSLPGEHPRLITADIVCHGVPSPLMFHRYLEWLDAKHEAPVYDYRFRDKTYGWGMSYSYKVGDRTIRGRSIFDPYNAAFLQGETYRETCYQCPYAQKNRQGDLTLADFWGVLKCHPGFYSEKGVSALMVNTEQGERLIDEIKEHIDVLESTYQNAARVNLNLRAPTPRPAVRNDVYKDIQLPGTQYIPLRLKANPSMKAIIKAFIPAQLKQWLGKLR